MISLIAQLFLKSHLKRTVCSSFVSE